MNPEEELEQHIKDKQEELRKLKDKNKTSARGRAVKELEEFTDEEKIAVFDSFHESAINDLTSLEKAGECEKDYEHWAWEAQMGVIARDHKAFWDYYNSLSR